MTTIEFTMQELSVVQSLVSTLQADYFKQGNDPRKSRKMAADQVGATYTPPLSAEELESSIARARSRLFSKKRLDGVEKFRNTIKQISANQADGQTSSGTMRKTYKVWCEQNNHVAPDAELSHFTGMNTATFHYARKVLIDEGFVFEKNGNGWNVTAPVKPVKVEKIYTEKQVRDIVEELLGKFGRNK